MTIFAVTGGRDYSDRIAVGREMRRWVNPGDPKSLVIQGGATGLDLLVRGWCHTNGVHCAEVRALWDYHGRPAGPIRNGVMLLLPIEFLLVFPGGAGTADMVKQAEAAGISVRRCLSAEGDTK